MKNYRNASKSAARFHMYFNCEKYRLGTCTIARFEPFRLIEMRLLFQATFLLISSFFLAGDSLLAQVTCGGGQVNTFCLNFPLQPYECIDGDADAPSLYGTKLLSPSQAQVTPQYLIVKGKVTFTEDYTFAAGSDIVFLDNNSGFRVYNNRKLTLIGSYLHGCTKLWAGVEVLPSAKITAENCTFRDAKAAIILRSLTTIEATGNNFERNLCGILALNANPLITSPISILLGNQNGISGNTFSGSDNLLESIVPATIDPGINSDALTTSVGNPYAAIWIERVNSLTIGFTGQSGGALNTIQDFFSTPGSGYKIY